MLFHMYQQLFVHAKYFKSKQMKYVKMIGCLRNNKNRNAVHTKGQYNLLYVPKA